MTSTPPHAHDLAGALTAAARDITQATRTGDPTQAPTLGQLREIGWQLIQLTGALSQASALLADQTGQLTGQIDQIRLLGGGRAESHIGTACRTLAALRHASDRASTAARDYYTSITHLAHDPAGSAP